MRFFHRMEISHTNKMGKKDIKAINKILKENKINYSLDVKNDLKICKFKNKFSIVFHEYPLFFCINNVYFPSIMLIEKEGIKFQEVVLDDGALKPILKGADVMAGGIFKNFDLCDNFKKNEVVVIKIKELCVGVGICLLNKEEINSETKGVVIDVFHYKNDDLYKFSL